MDDTLYNRIVKRLGEVGTGAKLSPEDAAFEAKMRAQEIDANPMSGLSKIVDSIPKLDTTKYTDEMLGKIYDSLKTKGQVGNLSKDQFIAKQNERLDTVSQLGTMSGGIRPVTGSVPFSKLSARLAPKEVPEGFGGRLSAAEDVERGLVAEAPAAYGTKVETPSKPYELPKQPANREALGKPVAELEYTPTESANMNQTLKAKVEGTVPSDGFEDVAMRNDRKRVMDRWINEELPSERGSTLVTPLKK